MKRRFAAPAARLALRFAGLLILLLTVVPSSRAGTLEAVRSRGFFLWGADKEGGGPYVFPDPSDPTRISGFEVELADMLAKEIGEVSGRSIEARFTQAQWDTLPSLLTTGRIDMILNGYEWTPERARLMDATLPYYIYELQLLVRAGERRFSGLEDLPGTPPRKVGVLGGSAAETWLRARFPGVGVAVVSYDGNTSAMGEVTTGKLDATLQDLPIALFYKKDFPTLRFAGGPVGPGRYVIYVRRDDKDLRERLDRAIVALRERGELRDLYERYGIWTQAQEDRDMLILPETGAQLSGPLGGAGRRAEAPEPTTAGSGTTAARSSTVTGTAAARSGPGPLGTEARETEGPGPPGARARTEGSGPLGANTRSTEALSREHGLVSVVRLHGATLARAAGMTVLLSIVSMPLAIFIGVWVALGRLYAPRPLALLLGAYIEVLRGTPLMLQLFVIFFLLPRIGIVISALPAAILGLAVNYSAYEAEIYRAGIRAIPSGQMEAALSLGMPRALALRRIVLPQAFRVVVPPMTNDFIALFKDTSVCSVITVVELTKQYNIAAMSSPSEILPLAAIAALLYLGMSYPLSVLASRLERRLER